MTRSSGALGGGPQNENMSAALFREQARAKVNLTLHVLGKRPDGYHELESLVVFADLCDELAFVPAPADSLSLQGPFAGAVDGENLVLKAKRIAADWLGRGIFGDFSLQKNIPVAAGLGGGSSDAAAAIRILFRVSAIRPERKPLSKERQRLVPMFPFAFITAPPGCAGLANA